jgi:uncharacterized protein with HEPN domain
MPRDDFEAHIADMITAARRAEEMLKTKSYGEFLEDNVLAWAIYSQFILLGEAARRIPRSQQELIPGIPWSEIIGMRHRLIHDYDVVAWEVVWDTVMRDFPPLIAGLEKLLQPEA